MPIVLNEYNYNRIFMAKIFSRFSLHNI